MKSLNTNYLGHSRVWWLILIAGVLLVLGGFAYWFFPAAGYATASRIFGWLLILTGVVQLCVSSGENRPQGWGWWLAGGVIDIFVGFMLVRSVILSEVVFPYFLAFIFIYWGIESFTRTGNHYGRYRWLGFINGILLCLIGFFFIEAGYVQNMMMISFLTSIAFIYWGFTIATAACEMRPTSEE